MAPVGTEHRDARRLRRLLRRRSAHVDHGGRAVPAERSALQQPRRQPVVVLPQVFPSTGAAGPSSVSLPAAVNPDLKIPYSMQYNLTVEHSRWNTGFRASYIGTNTRQGDYSYNYNSPVPDGRLFTDKPRPFPLAVHPASRAAFRRRRTVGTAAHPRSRLRL